MFSKRIIRVQTFWGDIGSSAKQIFQHDDRDHWFVLTASTTVTCNLHVGLINLFGSAGAVMTPVKESGTANLVNPIPIPPGFPLTVSRVGSVSGRYQITVGKLERL